VNFMLDDWDLISSRGSICLSATAVPKPFPGTHVFSYTRSFGDSIPEVKWLEFESDHSPSSAVVYNA
jgi:hypothetical protein